MRTSSLISFVSLLGFSTAATNARAQSATPSSPVASSAPATSESAPAVPPPPPGTPTTLAPTPIVAPAPDPFANRPFLGVRRVTEDDHGQPVPPGAVRDTRRPRWALITGLAGFGAAWIFAGSSEFAGVSCSSSSGSAPTCSPWISPWVWVPFAGPFIGAAEIASRPVGPDPGWEAVLIVDGILQLGFAGLFVGAMLVKPRRIVQYEIPIYGASPRRSPPMQWSLAPAPGGASFTLRF